MRLLFFKGGTLRGLRSLSRGPADDAGEYDGNRGVKSGLRWGHSPKVGRHVQM